MADYGCFPLWEASLGQVGNIGPDNLPISKELKADLIDWARSYDETLNLDDPVNSGFRSNEEEEHFKQRGRELGERLQAELGQEFFVKIKV